jgi:hypothetical protein|tara:strand:- start:32130 stop:33812 length:1683 start_codon:yes stop_codon:yes gene_type:complete
MQLEYIVALHNKEDLESFYEDMETEGGDLFIPDRAVDVTNKRLISRNTHYMLTPDEVELLEQDDRVSAVVLAVLDTLDEPAGYQIDEKFSKDWFADVTDTNWGLLRHSEELNRNNWGADGVTNINDELTITASGKHVDVVIVDGHIDPDCPEFAVNADGTGGSRVVQFNWFSLNQQVTGANAGTYLYETNGSYTDPSNVEQNNHGMHVAGTVAGNTQGWAREANIYNIYPYSNGPNGALGSGGLVWDFIRAWHNSKPINPETGRRNPTVTNHSYNSTIRPGHATLSAGFGLLERFTYRGQLFDPGRELTVAELQARGCYVNGTNASMKMPIFFSTRFSDIQDAHDDGIISTGSGGNDYWKIVLPGDQDYNNLARCQYEVLPGQFVDFDFYIHRGSGAQSGYINQITVGALSNDVDEAKAEFSNCGNKITVYAAGEGIISSMLTGGQADPRNGAYQLGKYQGTSMAAPQVCGLLAVLVEHWPNMNQYQALNYLINNSTEDEMTDTDLDDPMEVESLQGGPNKIARWYNQRQVSGNNFPRRNFRERTTAGVCYPRQRIRRRG